MNKIEGFVPDADPTTPGVLTDCANIIPVDAGFAGAPTAVAASVPVLAAQCRGAAVLTQLDGTRRIFGTTQTKIYELTGGAWTDRSAGGGSYTGSAESRWSMCQFGNTSVLGNLVDAMQSSATGAFAAIAGAPKARHVVSASNNFVIAFHTDEGTFGNSPDRWWCCAQNDQTNWTPSVATGATTGRIVAGEGGFTAALPLGDYVVAYKSKGLFLGSFVGSASGTWQWPQVPGGECGCVGPEAVCDIGNMHFIVGEDDFWLFDGTRPVSIGEGIRNWFRANSSQQYRYRTRITFDRQRGLVWINFASPTSIGACDRTLVYHIARKRFGRADFTGEAMLNYAAPGVTIDGLDAYSSSIDGLPAIGFDSQYWLSGGRAFAYFDANHQLVVNSGASQSSSITTSAVGDDDWISILERMRVRFTLAPTSAVATGLSKVNLGDAGWTAGAVEPIADGQFILWQSGRWHAARIDMTGPHSETGYDIRARQEAQA